MEQEIKSQIETEEEEKKGFDLTVHHRDRKSQRLSKITPYSLHCEKIGGESHKIFERDGKFFYANNQEVPDSENFVLARKKEKTTTQGSAKK